MNLFKRFYNSIKAFGIEPKIIINSLRGIPSFVRDYLVFKRRKNELPPEFNYTSIYPCLADRYSESGSAKGHYFHQDLLVAQKIFKNNPRKHVDIGSRIDGFVAHVASFREIEIFDVRELTSQIKNVIFHKADLMNDDFKFIDYCDSVSSLHAVEHFGLGRYGDPIEVNGHIKAVQNITKMLTRGGKFYFSVPMGPQRIEFNAQRVFSLEYLLELLSKDFEVVSFSFVDDEGLLHRDSKLEDDFIKTNFGCLYGCAIFELIKK